VRRLKSAIRVVISMMSSLLVDRVTGDDLAQNGGRVLLRALTRLDAAGQVLSSVERVDGGQRFGLLPAAMRITSRASLMVRLSEREEIPVPSSHQRCSVAYSRGG
jgi:hypothetical protein